MIFGIRLRDASCVSDISHHIAALVVEECFVSKRLSAHLKTTQPEEGHRRELVQRGLTLSARRVFGTGRSQEARKRYA